MDQYGTLRRMVFLSFWSDSKYNDKISSRAEKIERLLVGPIRLSSSRSRLNCDPFTCAGEKSMRWRVHCWRWEQLEFMLGDRKTIKSNKLRSETKRERRQRATNGEISRFCPLAQPPTSDFVRKWEERKKNPARARPSFRRPANPGAGQSWSSRVSYAAIVHDTRLIPYDLSSNSVQ